MKRFALAAVLLAAAVSTLTLAAQQGGAPAQAPAAAANFVPVTDQMLQNPDPADWLMWRRTLNHWGYSPLNQINRNNVRNLTLAWSRGLAPGLQEGTPLVCRGTMYFPNPLDVVQAFDAKTGDLKWEYRRRLPEDLNKFFPVPAINRNLAIYDNLIIDTSADDFVYALNANTGELAWETKIMDYQKGAQQTSGPIIANGKIISGRGCEPEGGPEACVITAHDARSGKELWRFHTIPRQGEPGFETWGNIPYEERKHVGAWMVPSFDPELNLIFIGTSVTSPAPKYLLGGNANEHLYHNSTLAINADTGRLAWHYQHAVDHWDLDHPFERLIVETAVAPNAQAVRWINPRLRAGERRKVITGVPGKTGLVYTLDARTGEFLWATPTVLQTVISAIDGATGKVTINPEMLFQKQGDSRFVCPNANGGKNWQAAAYSPQTNMMYVPLQNTCAEMTATLEKPDPASLYGLNMKTQIATGTNNVGTIHAINAETGLTPWKFEQRAGTSTLIATGGGLVFAGDVNGRFRALDETSGKVLWETNLGSAVTGFPATFSVDGKQYVAISTGTSLATGGVSRLAPELRPSNSNQLFVFALP
ncbi:MAG: pyrroloquinoline quinone-dependent dehydrogenase [Vicinamibacterales bacterium]